MLDPFVKGWEAGQISKVNDIIKTGFITGRTNAQITQDIAGKNGYLDNQNRKSIKTMVRTATTHTSSLARQQTMEENDDIVIGYEWVSTLDSRTSNICKGLDGKIYKHRDKNKRYPPAHPNCRSSTAPVLDQRFNVDGIVTTRASRGVEGGQQVAADTTYYGWLKGQGAQGPKGRAFVMDVLGKERGELFLDGGLSASKFKQLTTDELFQPIPLDELRKKQSLQLAFDAID
jgi:SPP1 gp7 family putative phage head morphogenesis protein